MSDRIDRLWLRAQRYIATNQIAAAHVTLEALLARAPERADARMLLASVILSEGRVRNAAAHARRAASDLPDDASVVSSVAHCLLRLGETVAARDLLQRFDADRCRDGAALTQLAHAFQMLGEHARALALMDRARDLGHDHADFRYFRGLQLQFNGRLAEAERELEACLALGPSYGRAALTLARMRKQTSQSHLLDYVRHQLTRVTPGSEDQAALEFAQFEILDDLGEHDAAFAALTRGNAIMHARLRHDSARERSLIDALIAATPRAWLTPADRVTDGPLPIFIVGLPRSGTTLLDRILDNHSQIVSTGERSEFPRLLRWAADRHGHELLDAQLLAALAAVDYAELGARYLAETRWRAPMARFYVDKLPPNFLLVGLIHRALPEAPILHLVREPMDVCFSNYKAMFGDSYPYSYDLDALAAHHSQYRRLMRHWHEMLPGRILDVSYADLVSDPETTVRRILTHCGVAFEADCLDLRRNRSAVDTLSSAQVREGLHDRALGAWRRYERQLQPLAERLATLESG
jgi:tetratricopeptide (TPR) repeat protein